MIKALLKKQALGLASTFLYNKEGKRRGNAAIFGFVALILYGFGASGAMFWLLASALCEPLVAAGLGWVYFAFMGFIATCFGIIGGVFTAKNALYEAKDNDLLLSMPIPAWVILGVRMLGVYLFIFFFEALVFVPVAAYYLIKVQFSVATLLLCLLVQVLMPLGAMAICCLLGFLLAVVIARIPFKNLFTILGFAAFMVLYFLVYSKINEYLSYVIANGEAVGATMKTALFPFAKLGLAVTGSGIDLFWFLLVFIGAFAIVGVVLARTYFKVATLKRGERQPKFKSKIEKSQSPILALCKRECLHLLKTPMYLLNAGMGTLLMLITAVMAVVKGDLFTINPEMLASIPTLSENIGLLCSVIVCFMASSNTIAAVSVSLEGNSLWILKSLPISSRLVLRAKIVTHFLFTAIPATVFSVVIAGILQLSVWWTLAVAFVAVVTSAIFAIFDLAVNLRFPNLHWTNEVAAIKQSISTVIAMFGGWGIALLPLGGWFWFGKYLPAWGYYCIALAYLILIGVGALLWIKKYGEKRFEELY